MNKEEGNRYTLIKLLKVTATIRSYRPAEVLTFILNQSAEFHNSHLIIVRYKMNSQSNFVIFYTRKGKHHPTDLSPLHQ